MGYEPGGTAFLRAHHPLKSFEPFHMAIAVLETSTKEITQKKMRGNLYVYLDVYEVITSNGENWKQPEARQQENG